MSSLKLCPFFCSNDLLGDSASLREQVACRSDLPESVATGLPANEGDDACFRVYHEVQRLEDFHALAHDTDLLSLMRCAVGEPAFAHPRGVVAPVFPDDEEFATPPHHDDPTMRQRCA